MKKLTLLWTCFIISMGLAIAQTKQVSGTVFDVSGEPVVGASVIVKGNAAIGTVSDINGYFSLNVPESATHLVVKFLGMRDQDVAAGSGISVTMIPSESVLDEVIVVAYGTNKKSTFTGSAGVISSQKIERRTVANVTKAIEGTVPGVLTTSGSGQPGSGASIRIRGFGSINSSNDPLYVVDGAPYDGSISAINPNDIETITLLKDAAAGALYGARGANGVVMITTKRGSETSDRAKIEVKAKWGVSSRAIPQYDLMNEQEFLEQSFLMYKNEQIYNYGIAPEKAGATAIEAMLNGTNRLFGVNEQYNPYNMPFKQLMDPVTGKINPNAKLRYSENWMDAATVTNPLRQEYDISVTGGGTSKTKYFASLGYLDEQGILPTTSFSRVNGRLNLDSKALDWWKIGGNISFAYNKNNYNDASGTGSGNVWYSAQNMAPIYPLYEKDSDGNTKYDGSGNPLYDYGVDRPAGAIPNFNSIALLYDDKYGSQSDNYNITGYSIFDLADSKYGYAQGVSFTVLANLASQNATSMTYYNPLWGNAGSQQGRLSKNATRIFSYTTSAILGYNRKFDEHSFDFMAGHEFYNRKYNNLNASKTGFPFPGLYELNPGAVLASIGSYEDNYSVESFLSRFRYSYADKYNFDVSARRDGSSVFHKDSRWGNFWSVGANWRVSEEEFLRDIEWVDNISLRASYGVQGNDNLLNTSGNRVYYAWQSFYTLGYPNAGYNSSYLSSLENRDLQWEKNANFNVGLETKLFNDRLDIVAEFYNRRTYDLLLSVPMATSLGFDSYNANIGEVNNKGFELTLGVNVVKSTNFDWRINFIGQTLKNKVVKLATDRPIIGTQIIKVGAPLYSYYRPESAGVDPATGKQLYWVWDKRDPVTDERDPESPRYISNDPAKAANSRVVGGSRTPDYWGSIGSEFRIFDFDLSFLSTYAIGGKILDGQYNSYMEQLYRGSNFHKNIQRAWKQPGDITDIPRAEFNSTNVTTLGHLVDASYFSIRNVTLGYTFSKKLSRKIGLEGLRIYATGDNLITFTHLDGLDPQSSFTGSSTYHYIPARTISAGININF